MALVHRVRRLVYQTEDGKPKATEQVLSSDMQPAWCSIGCWEEMADALIAALALKTPFPGSRPVVPCSRCGEPVDNTKPHVAYVVLDIEVQDAPWAATAKVHWSRLLAVLCWECEAPDGHQAAIGLNDPAPREEASDVRDEFEPA
jgi:hypothetical protein